MARILIAEDNPENLYLLQLMLEADEHQVTAAGNGAEALEKALQHPPEVIISDIMMPTMNGFRFCREVRNHPELKKIPFVFYTATFLEEEDRRLAMNLGATRFVVKPMASPQFAEIIQDVLEQHRRGELPPPPPPTAASDALLAMYDTSLNRKLAETVEKLRAEHRALARSEARLKEAQEIAQIGHWELDLHSGTLSWSDQLYRLLQQTPQASPASWQDLLTAVHPDDRQQVAAAQRLARIQKGAFSLDYRLLLADGTLKYVHERCQTQFDEFGAPDYAVGTIQDVTDAKLAEKALQESEVRVRALNAELENRVADRTSALERANRELEAYSYSVSHDLRAPLRAISGFAKVLLEDHAGELSAEARRLLGRITANSDQMGQLIDDLLAFAQMDRKLLHKEPIDLGQLVEHCRSLLQAEINQRRVQFRCGPLPVIFGDRAMLQQAMLNLLDNALKFTRTIPEAIIEIGMLEKPDAPVYYIKDNGVGFDMGRQGKLFGVFQRLHRSEDFEGTGVGLAIVHRIIRRHGGKIWIEGEVNKGATVFFTL